MSDTTTRCTFTRDSLAIDGITRPAEYSVTPAGTVFVFVAVDVDGQERKVRIKIPADDPRYAGDSATGMLEAIYAIFNTNHPKDYAGRSLSVSDLVTLDGIGTYFCDSFGFRRLDDQLTIFDR